VADEDLLRRWAGNEDGTFLGLKMREERIGLTYI